MAISLGMALAPGVAVAEPDGAGSSASSDSSSAPGGRGGATDSSGPQQGAVGPSGPDSTLNSQSTQDTSSEISLGSRPAWPRSTTTRQQVDEAARWRRPRPQGAVQDRRTRRQRGGPTQERQTEACSPGCRPAGDIRNRRNRARRSISGTKPRPSDQSGLTLEELSAVLDAAACTVSGSGQRRRSGDAESLQAVRRHDAADIGGDRKLPCRHRGGPTRTTGTRSPAAGDDTCAIEQHHAARTFRPPFGWWRTGPNDCWQHRYTRAELTFRLPEWMPQST